MRIRVSELMNTRLLFLQFRQSIAEAARLFVENGNMSALPVLDDNQQLIGFLSQKQLLAALAQGLSAADGIGMLVNPEFARLSSNDWLPFKLKEQFE